jgi:hypothetical protein
MTLSPALAIGNNMRAAVNAILDSESGDSIEDILRGTVMMSTKEKYAKAWRIFLGLDLDQMLKEIVGLDNLEKFKANWKDEEQWTDDPDQRAEYDEAMYPAVAIYYPIEERSIGPKALIKSMLYKRVKAELESHGFNIDQMGWKADSGGKDLWGQIRRHLEGYINGWITYHRLDDLDAMEVLYR